MCGWHRLWPFWLPPPIPAVLLEALAVATDEGGELHVIRLQHPRQTDHHRAMLHEEAGGGGDTAGLAPRQARPQAEQVRTVAALQRRADPDPHCSAMPDRRDCERLP